jgi:hypothetical protein
LAHLLLIVPKKSINRHIYRAPHSGPWAGPHDPLHDPTKSSRKLNNPWKAMRRLRLRDIWNMSQTRSSPRPGQSCPRTWAHKIWTQGDALIRHVESHVPEDTKTHVLDRVNTHVSEVETYDQRASSCHFQGKPTPPTFSINTDLPSGIPLAEIIIIKAFIQIIQRINLKHRSGTSCHPQ